MPNQDPDRAGLSSLTPLKFGSLFAGIGGLDLGLERAGMECKWQVEIDDYATRVLEKHWPNVRRWRDVRDFPPEPVDEWRVDLICGGFPCQDISYAGRGAGITGERSGLFFEALRVVRQLRPRYVLLENVAALLTRGLDVVLGTLGEIGFDAEWHCVPAAAVGAPHIRDRVFVLAHASDSNDTQGGGTERWTQTQPRNIRRSCSGWITGTPIFSGCDGSQGTSAGAGNGQNKQPSWSEQGERGYVLLRHISRWEPEPNVDRVANGVPSRVDRLRCLGNAVVPQVAEWIGKRIVEAAGKETT